MSSDTLTFLLPEIILVIVASEESVARMMERL